MAAFGVEVFFAIGDGADLIIGGKLGAGLETGVSAGVDAIVGVAAGPSVVVGIGVVLGVSAIRGVGLRRERSLGLIGRTGSRYCV